MWGNKFKCLDQESCVTRRASNITRHRPEYLSRAESWLEWDSRQSQFLPESFSNPHSAQWNSGCSGRSHRVSPSVPSKANINTQGDGNPGRHARIPGQTRKTLSSRRAHFKTRHQTTEAKFTPASAHVLFRVPSVSLRTKRTSITLSLLAS